MFRAVQINFVIYLVVSLLEVNVQSDDYPSFALKGYLIGLSSAGNFDDWLHILGNRGQLEQYYGQDIEDEEDLDICDYIKDLFEKKLGNSLAIVTCEQKPAIHELHPDKPISAAVYLDKELWNALTDECLQSPEDLLAHELNGNSDGENKLQVTELPDPGEVYAYDIKFRVNGWMECNRTLIDKAGVEFREKLLPQIGFELLYSKVRCSEEKLTDYVKFRQFYNESDVEDQFQKLEIQPDDFIQTFYGIVRINPIHRTLDDDHADLCGGNYKSESSSTITSNVSTIWSTKNQETPANTPETPDIATISSNVSTIWSTKNQETPANTPGTPDIVEDIESSHSIRMVFSEASYVLVTVSLHILRMA